MRISLILTILASTTIIFAQKPEDCACKKKDKATIRQYFVELDEQNKFITECEQKKENNQKLISGRCEWGGSGCPTSLVKPEFPSIAKKLKISGSVKVEIIVDENGSVIYSKMIEGNRIFRKSAERAACQSKFTPFRFCNKTFKYKTVIKFYFVP